MSLTNDQAIEAVKNPPNRSQVLNGRKYQSRLRILTEAYGRSEIKQQTAWTELTAYLQNVLTVDKYNAILKVFTFPLSIVNISNDIMTDLYTVFNGRNASFSTEYPNDRFKEIAERMMSEINIRSWIEKKGKQVLKSAPNSITVIDIDANGNPILLLVPNEKLEGYVMNKDGTFNYIVFVHSKGKNAQGNPTTRHGVYDEEFYRVVLEDSGNFTVEVESPHNLGYCPAMFFYNKPKLNIHEFDRSIPISNVAGQMQKWTVFDEFVYYADQYGAFPAMEYADNGCDINGCESGMIAGYNEIDEDNNISGYVPARECPNCSTKGLIGPGTAVGITVSEDADVQDTRGVLNFVTPDVSGLKYVREVQAARENFIKQNTVGFTNVSTSMAVNEAQIRFLVESRSKAPREISMHLSMLYVWIVKTLHLLMFDAEVSTFANFGTEFLVQSEKDILFLIQEAKKAGVQAGEIVELNKLLIQTKYKTQPEKVRRLMIEADLQPSVFDTREEVEKKNASGMITKEDYYQYLNFNDLISQFELDNGSIVAFGAELPYSTKIDRIKKTLLFYTQQKLITNEAEDDNTELLPTGGQGAGDN